MLSLTHSRRSEKKKKKHIKPQTRKYQFFPSINILKNYTPQSHTHTTHM